MAVADLRVPYKEVGSRRIMRFGASAQLNTLECLGVLALFWHDTQAEGLVRETREVLAQYVTCDPKRADALIDAMVLAGYITADDGLTYTVVGNERGVARRQMARVKGQKAAAARIAKSAAPAKGRRRRKTDAMHVAQAEATPADATALRTQGDTPFKAACRVASLAYIKAVESVTGQLPIRNAKYHSQMQQIVKRLGGASAAALEFYVRRNTDPQVVRQLWPLGHFLTQAESIAMQANMGRYISLDDAKAFTSTAQYEQRQQDILAGRL